MDESLVAQRPGRAPPVEKEWELESKDSRQDGGDEDEGEDESSLEQQKRDVLIQEELNWLRKHNPPEYVRRMDEAAKRAEFRQWFRVMDADGFVAVRPVAHRGCRTWAPCGPPPATRVLQSDKLLRLGPGRG